MLLDEKPLVPLASRTPRFNVNQREIAFQALTVEPKLQVALGEHGSGFGISPGIVFAIYRDRRERLPGADIPNDHAASSVVAFRDRAFKVEIRNRMILHLHREALVRRIERRPLRNSP